MNLLNQSAFLKALGWSLLDSLWQMGILWLLYVLLTANGKKFKSRQRHNLALLSLTGGSVWFFISFGLNYYRGISIPVSTTISTNVNGAADLSGFFSSLPLLLEPFLPFLSIVYLSVLFILFVRLYLQYNKTQFLFTNSIHKINPELRVFLHEMVQRMSIKKEVRIWLSELVDTPLTVGFWKPVILLPVAAVNHLSLEQAEAIILHELHHIKGNDYLLNLLIASIDILLFFNPFSRVMTDIIKKERENSCDDLVLQFKYDVKLYAKALLTLEQNRKFSSVGLAATGKNRKLLLDRVKRMLKNEPVRNTPGQKLVAYLFSSILIGFIGLYNPGKVIVDPAEANPIQVSTVSLPELPKSFTSTPPLLGEKLVRKIKKNITEKSMAGLTEPANELQNPGEENQIDENENAADFVTYTSSPEVREFSIPQNNIVIAPVANLETYPYVPRSSFSYNILEDTSYPKKYIPTVKDIKAKEALDKTVKAMQEINWQRLEKGMKSAGKKLDVVRLQKELIKALEDVDWKKINEDAESTLDEPSPETLNDQFVFKTQLEKYQKERIISQEKLKKAQQAIIQDRLKEKCEELKNEDNNKQKLSTSSEKKIVYI